MEPLAFPAEPKRLTAAPWVFVSKRESELMDRLAAAGPTLGEISERIFQGLKTGADSVYILDRVKETEEAITVYSKALKREYVLEPDLLKPLIKGGQMRRYLIEEPKRWILFPYRQGERISAEQIASRCPRTWHYLMENKEQLERREHGKMRGEKWYEYSRVQALDVMEFPKIITPDVAASATFCYDSEGKYYFTGGAAGGYGVLLRKDINPAYVLGLLNSKLLDWYLHNKSSRFRGGYFSYEARFIRQLPIRRIDFDNPEEKKMHDDLVALVERMLELNKRLRETVGREREELERKIERTDREIDELVYRLYGLTEEEIRVVQRQG